MAEAHGQSPEIFAPLPVPVALPVPAHAPVSAGRWENDGMSYEEMCQLEDVKVTASKQVLDSLCVIECTSENIDNQYESIISHDLLQRLITLFLAGFAPFVSVALKWVIRQRSCHVHINSM